MWIKIHKSSDNEQHYSSYLFLQEMKVKQKACWWRFLKSRYQLGFLPLSLLYQLLDIGSVTMTWSDEGHYTGVVGYYRDEDSSRLRLMECPMGNIQPRQDLTWTLENFTDGPTKPTTGTFPGPIREPLLDLFSGGLCGY